VNTTRLTQRLSYLVGTTALVLGFGALSAQAESAKSAKQSQQLNSVPTQNFSIKRSTAPVSQPNLDKSPFQIATAQVTNSQVANSGSVNSGSVVIEPTPGKALTSASSLTSTSSFGVDALVPYSSVVAQKGGTSQETTPGTVPAGQATPGSTTPGSASPGTVVPGQPPADIVQPSPTNPKPRSTTPDVSPSPGTTSLSSTPSGTTPADRAPGTTSPDGSFPGTSQPGSSSNTDNSPTSQTIPGTTPSPETTVTPGRSTRSGSSYFGIGGNIGIGSGDTAVGEGSFAVLSKIGLTRSFSVRPSLLISDDVTILLPITYDFSFGEGPTEGFGFRAAPFVGLGPAITTGGGGSVDLLLTGGIDIPISSQFTATASVNASVTGEPAVGILLGIGYNFAGF